MPRILNAINLDELHVALNVVPSVQSAQYGSLACPAQPLDHASPDERCRRGRCVRLRPESRLETLHEANVADNSAIGFVEILRE